MQQKSPLVEGMIAGALGYLAVGAFFALLNVASGNSPFLTAFLVGEAIGARGPGPEGTVGVILAANALHLVISLIAGAAAAWLMNQLEHHHGIWYAVLLAFLGGFFLSVVVAGVLATEVAAVATWVEVTVANAIGASAIGAYLWRAHRELIQELKEEFGG